MGDISTMLVALGINTGPFTAGLAKAKGELTGFAAEADASGKKASSSMNGVGIASLAVVGGVAAIGVSAIKSASDFQASMTLVQTQAGVSAKEVQNMSAAVLALAPTVGIGPEQLSTGLYHVESAGLRGAKALDLLKVAAQGAKVGGADLESVTNALIASVQSGVGGVKSMTGAMGTLNAIVGSGNMRMQDLADAFGTGVLSTAKNYGVTIQSVGAALASMTDQGIPAIDAATRLNSAMRLMAAPTRAARDDLKSIGLSATQLATDMRKPNGMLVAITDLKTHLMGAGLTATQQAALIANAFGGKQSGAILTLIGNVDLLKAKTADVAAGAGKFGAAWTAYQQTAAAQGDELSASIDTVKDSIGIGLLPALNSVFKVIVPVIQNFAAWAAQNPGLASQILLVVGAVAALVAAVAFLGPILGGIGALIGVITSPILLVIGAIAALAAHFGLLGQGAKDAVDGIIDMIASAIPGVISMLGNLASQALAWVGAQAPIFLAQLLSWADAFVGWIGPMIPVALAALADFGSRLVQWVLDEIPIVAAGISMLAGQLVNWILPKIPDLLGQLAQFGYSLVNWILGEVGVVAGAMVQLANSAIGALVNAFIADPSLIVKGIALMLGGVAVVAAAQAAATVVGAAYTLAMKAAATLSSAIADFASAIASAILTKLTTMAAAGGIVGTAIGVAMKVGALAVEGFGSIGTAIAGVIGTATPTVAAAASTQGTVAGAAGALSFGAALTLGMVTAAAAAVAAVWAIINDGLNKQVGAIQTRLNQVIQTQTLAQLQQDKAAIGTGIAQIMSISAGMPDALRDIVYGDQLKGLRAQMAQVDAQIAKAQAATASADQSLSSAVPGPKGLVAVPDLVAIPEKTAKLVAVPEKAAPAAPSTTAAVNAAVAAIVAATSGATKASSSPSAAALATAPVTAATSAAAQATTAAQIHLESMKVQLQTAELAANAGDAAAAQQVLVLKAEIAHQQAADAVAAAQRAVTVAETTVKASHDKLVLAQEGRLKGVNIVATSEAAYKLAQDKLALATAKLTLAQGSAALQAQAAVTKAAAAAPGNPLGFLEPAGGITGAGGAVGMISGSTTASTVSASSAGASGYAIDWAALKEVAAAFRQAISSGVPLTLDGQTVGDLVSQHAYVSASMATSGFVAQGSIG